MESEKNGTSPNTKSRDDLENGANLKNGKSRFGHCGKSSNEAVDHIAVSSVDVDKIRLCP